MAKRCRQSCQSHEAHDSGRIVVEHKIESMAVIVRTFRSGLARLKEEGKLALGEQLGGFLLVQNWTRLACFKRRSAIIATSNYLTLRWL